jgi:glycosyltransferase involved in cell wall biosynthesis
MKILQICHKPPLPAVDGGCIAMNNITEGLLQNGHQVTVLTISTHKHPFLSDKIPKAYFEATNIKSVFVKTDIKPATALTNLLKGDSYNVSRFYSTEFAKLIGKTISNNQFDIIHLESVFVTPYLAQIRELTDAKVVLRAHNVEFLLWEKKVSKCNSTIKKSYLKKLAKQLKAYETSLLNSYDGIAAISATDIEAFQNLGCTIPTSNIPFGIDTQKYKSIFQSKPRERTQKTIFHLGAMDWEPNQEAIAWFIEKVWPMITKENSNVQFIAAGRNMPDKFYNYKSETIQIRGEVDDAVKFISAHDIMVVPLFNASGLRIKIIEGMALGKAIVSTAQGAEGIKCKHNENIVIASNEADFAKAVLNLVNNPQKAEEIGARAQKLAKEHYDIKNVTHNLAAFYQQLLDE